MNKPRLEIEKLSDGTFRLSVESQKVTKVVNYPDFTALLSEIAAVVTECTQNE